MNMVSLEKKNTYRYSRYLCKFNVGRVAQNSSIRLFVARIANQLRVPNSKIMFAICPLWKYCNG